MKTRMLNFRLLRRIWHPSQSYARTIEAAARNEPGALRIQRWGWTRFVVAIKHRPRATKPNTPSRKVKFRPPDANGRNDTPQKKG